MATAAQKRKESIRLIRSRAGKNSYTQVRPGNFWGDPGGGAGKGDCSLTVQQVILRAAGINIGGNTSAQIDNRGKGIMIEDNRSGKRSYPTPGLMEEGDCIYYRGNTAHSWDVGHVELHTASNECYGHGSGQGPTKKNEKTYSQNRSGSRKYLCTIRWIRDDDKVYKLGERGLKLGMVAADVGALQEMLLKLGYNLGTYGAKKNGVDGDYGAKTAAAVKVEQKCAGLTQTGEADVVTIAHIIAHASGGTAPATIQHVIVTGGTVNIRRGPSTNHGVVGYVKSGDKFKLLGVDSATSWYKIAYKNSEAWISYEMCEVE